MKTGHANSLSIYSKPINNSDFHFIDSECLPVE
jgi:hypothetical protein